jgi:hypothetical protein
VAMEGLYQQVPRIRARRTLDMADAALYAQLMKLSSQSAQAGSRWRASVERVAYPVSRAVDDRSPDRSDHPSRFSWNGEPVGVRGLKHNLMRTIGGGLFA